MKEIGSEFWLDDFTGHAQTSPEWLKFGQSNMLLYSGRTAIDYVLNDIPERINTVYFPLYCCASMLQPFLERKINIIFYDVYFNGSDIEYSVDFGDDYDLFFAMSYFGSSNTAIDHIIRDAKSKRLIVIEDITHRMFNDKPSCSSSDYLVSSLRKWMPLLTGGLAVKRHGEFSHQDLQEIPEDFLKVKLSAMKIKADYMISELKNPLDKKMFIKLYQTSNQQFSNKYKGLKCDTLSERILFDTDIDNMKYRRQKNAEYIIGKIQEQEIYKQLTYIDLSIDCPLFVPIILSAESRQKLKDYLVDHNIYCPIHWPVPKYIRGKGIESNLFSQTLSLVCDQRYNEEDMEYMMSYIERCFN